MCKYSTIFFFNFFKQNFLLILAFALSCQIALVFAVFLVSTYYCCVKWFYYYFLQEWIGTRIPTFASIQHQCPTKCICEILFRPPYLSWGQWSFLSPRTFDKGKIPKIRGHVSTSRWKDISRYHSWQCSTMGKSWQTFCHKKKSCYSFIKKELWKIREIDTTTNLKLFSHYIPRRPEINVAETAMIKIITLHNEFEAIYCRSDMSKCIVFGKIYPEIRAILWK